MEQFLEILSRKIDWKLKEFQSSLKYYLENDSELMRDEINVLRGQIFGLKFCEQCILESLKDSEHQKVFDEFIEKSNEILDKIDKIVSK